MSKEKNPEGPEGPEGPDDNSLEAEEPGEVVFNSPNSNENKIDLNAFEPGASVIFSPSPEENKIGPNVFEPEQNPKKIEKLEKIYKEYFSAEAGKKQKQGVSDFTSALQDVDNKELALNRSLMLDYIYSYKTTEEYLKALDMPYFETRYMYLKDLGNRLTNLNEPEYLYKDENKKNIEKGLLANKIKEMKPQDSSRFFAYLWNKNPATINKLYKENIIKKEDVINFLNEPVASKEIYNKDRGPVPEREVDQIRYIKSVLNTMHRFDLIDKDFRNQYIENIVNTQNLGDLKSIIESGKEFNKEGESSVSNKIIEKMIEHWPIETLISINDDYMPGLKTKLLKHIALNRVQFNSFMEKDNISDSTKKKVINYLFDNKKEAQVIEYCETDNKYLKENDKKLVFMAYLDRSLNIEESGGIVIEGDKLSPLLINPKIALSAINELDPNSVNKHLLAFKVLAKIESARSQNESQQSLSLKFRNSFNRTFSKAAPPPQSKVEGQTPLSMLNTFTKSFKKFPDR